VQSPRHRWRIDRGWSRAGARYRGVIAEFLPLTMPSRGADFTPDSPYVAVQRPMSINPEAERCAHPAGEPLHARPLERGKQLADQPPSGPASSLQLNDFEETFGIGVEDGGKEWVRCGDLDPMAPESLVQVAPRSWVKR
jgi:hypothetical protein